MLKQKEIQKDSEQVKKRQKTAKGKVAIGEEAIKEKEEIEDGLVDRVVRGKGSYRGSYRYGGGSCKEERGGIG